MLPLSYCLFMLTCFGNQSTSDNIWSISSCPSECECYDAPSNGISGTDAISLLCPSPESILYFPFQANLKLNTLIFKNGLFQNLLYSNSSQHKWSISSLILENFTFQNDNQHYLFQNINSQSLKFLSIYNSKLVNSPGNVSQFSWASSDFTSIETLTNLEVINFENCHLEVVDNSFSKLAFSKLHTLIIKSSQLSFIHRDAFDTGKENLRKLFLSRNKLKNLIWLTGTILPNLWNLDLSSNYLRFLPPSLKESLPNLQVLNIVNNRYLYFQFQSIQPWLGIQELSLHQEGAFSNDATPEVLFFVEEMHWLKNLSNMEVSVNYLISSFVAGFNYQCPESQNSMNWIEFLNLCNQTFDYLPNHLYFNQQGKLMYPEYHFSSQSPTIHLNGLNVPFANFTFDQSFSLDDFEVNRRDLVETLEIMDESQNAIRLQVFSERMLMLDFDLKDHEIDLLIDQIEEFLDEASQKRKFVVLVLWNYQNILENSEIFELMNFDEFEVRVLRPLLNRISHHSALLGIEIISNFLSDQLESPKIPESFPDEDCTLDTEFQSMIQSKLNFLSQNLLIVQKYLPAHKPIGVSISADCYLCLPLVTLPSCLTQVWQMFDFVTLFSSLAKANSEEYSYLNFPNRTQKLREILGEGFEKIGIFYVIEDEKMTKSTSNKNWNTWLEWAIANMKNYASGYFVTL